MEKEDYIDWDNVKYPIQITYSHYGDGGLSITYYERPKLWTDKFQEQANEILHNH